MSSVRKITAVFFVILAILCPLLFPAGAEAFRYSDDTAAARAALALLRECAFIPEYGDGTEQPLCRWEDEITVWAGGGPTREDLQALDAFLAELNRRLPGFPGIRRVRRDTDAAVRVWFVPGYMLSLYIEGYVEGNWGFFSFNHPGGKIVSARIGIASDLTEQEDRNHLILEELVGALGLPGDHSRYSDSILYDGWTTSQSLSDVDWRMLDMLYSPVLSPGMLWPDARDALRRELDL